MQILWVWYRYLRLSLAVHHLVWAARISLPQPLGLVAESALPPNLRIHDDPLEVSLSLHGAELVASADGLHWRHLLSLAGAVPDRDEVTH